MAGLTGRKAKENFVFLPADPLADMLASNFECGDIDSISDNSVQPETAAWCVNPHTGKYEVYATYEPKPELSEIPLMIPADSAEALENLVAWNCPFPLQLRHYCNAIGNDPNGWDTLLHHRRVRPNTGNLAAPTAQGPGKDDNTPSVTRNAQYLGPWIRGSKNPPGYFASAAGRTPVAVIYADAPNCGACDGSVTDGCQIIYALYDITATSLAELRYSLDGGTTWTTVVLSGGVSTETDPRDLLYFNGRLIMTIADTVYYSDNGTVGSSWTEGDTTTTAAITTTGKLATNGSYAAAIFNTSGVMRSEDGENWFQVTAGISADAQNAISAAGDVFVTVGDNDSIQISVERGEAHTWQLLGTGPGGATDDGRDVAVALRDPILAKSAVIYVAQTTGAATLVYKSNNLGLTWSTERTIGSVEAGIQIEAPVDGDWIWINYDAVTEKNHNRGRGVEWIDVSNGEVGSNGTRFAVCGHNPNVAFVVSNA